MKAKISRGNGFQGTLNYILDQGQKATGEKKPELISGNMSSDDAKALTKEFQFSKSLRPKTKNPVWHCSLTLPKGERLDSAKWDRIAKSFLKKLDIDTNNHQFIAVRHQDTKLDHIHIVMSRIGIDGKLWHGRNDVKKAIEASQMLENEFSLKLTTGYNKHKNVLKKPLKSPEINMAIRKDELPPRIALQNILDEAMEKKQNVFAFLEKIESTGAKAIPNVATTGRLNGFSFMYDGIKFKGSDLGSKYNWKELKQTIIYEQERDSKQLIQTAQRIKQEVNEIHSRESRKSIQDSGRVRRGSGNDISDSRKLSQNQQSESGNKFSSSGNFTDSQNEPRRTNKGYSESRGETVKSIREDESNDQSHQLANKTTSSRISITNWGYLNTRIDNLLETCLCSDDISLSVDSLSNEDNSKEVNTSISNHIVHQRNISTSVDDSDDGKPEGIRKRKKNKRKGIGH